MTKYSAAVITKEMVINKAKEELGLSQEDIIAWRETSRNMPLMSYLETIWVEISSKAEGRWQHFRILSTEDLFWLRTR